MKKVFIILFSLCSFFLQGQELIPNIQKNTSFNLNYGFNVNFSTLLESRSIGGEWGMVVDHQFPNKRYGISAGIIYSLVHVGFQNEFTSPSEALEFGILESAFGLFYAPFKEITGIRFKLGYTQALVVRKNYYINNYNIPILTFGCEYAIPTKTNLALTFGWNNKFYTIDKLNFGYNLTNVIYCKVGLKN